MHWDRISSTKFVNTLTCWRGIIMVWSCGILLVPGYLFFIRLTYDSIMFNIWSFFFLNVSILCLLIQVWLDCAKEIRKQIKSMWFFTCTLLMVCKGSCVLTSASVPYLLVSGPETEFFFNIKFYPPDPSILAEDITRYNKTQTRYSTLDWDLTHLHYFLMFPHTFAFLT